MMRIRLTLQSTIASLALAAVMMTTGCTPAQKQTELQIITNINTHLPEVVAAAQTVAATVSALAPADALIIGVADTAFTAGAQTLQALTAAYIANPNATVLAQIQNAITALEGQINTATLNAVGIKNAQTVQFVLAALKGLLTVVTVVFGLIAPTLTKAQLTELRDSNTIHLARVRRYMDEDELQREATAQGVNLNRSFAMAEAHGL